MELNNRLTRVVQQEGSAPREVVRAMVLMLAPLTPHVAEELWARLGEPDRSRSTDFPEPDPALLVDDTVEVPVQVNGKVRAQGHGGHGRVRGRPRSGRPRRRADRRAARRRDRPQGRGGARPHGQLRRRLSSAPSRGDRVGSSSGGRVGWYRPISTSPAFLRESARPSAPCPEVEPHGASRRIHRRARSKSSGRTSSATRHARASPARRLDPRREASTRPVARRPASRA